jgi:Mg/Co/Ni transporter MgtE
MFEEDLHRIAVAAADKEAAAFELDHADLNLKEAVVVALENGTPPEVIAQIADLEPDEVIDLVHDIEEPALLTLADVDPMNARKPAEPTTQAPIVQDAS